MMVYNKLEYFWVISTYDTENGIQTDQVANTKNT